MTTLHVVLFHGEGDWSCVALDVADDRGAELVGEGVAVPRRHGWRILLVMLLTGCRATPGRVAACEHPNTPMPRAVIGVRQILVDTAQETARHPVRSLVDGLLEPALGMQSLTYAILHKGLVQRLIPRPPPVSPGRPVVDPEELEEALHRVAGDDLRPADVALFIDGDEALAALDAAIDGATQRIDVLMYLWGGDAVGWHVARKLAARAGPHLPVRVLVDGGGSMFQGEPEGAGAGEVNAAACWLASQPHVRVVRVRNPYLRFDHRKLVLVDGRLAWSGGRNFTSEAFHVAHDLSYTLAGPLTGEIAVRYEQCWKDNGGPPGPATPPPESAVAPNAMARLVRTRPYESNLARTVYAAVREARHHVYAENPYFSDAKLLVELAKARRRGADVRVVLTLDSGNGAHDLANRATANWLLRAGVRVYLYPIRTHVKALSVDGVWAYMGTANFDTLSLRHNRELGVAVSHGPLIGELEQRLFHADFRPDWELREPLRLVGYEYFFELLASLTL
jgi:cardiolipin synthase